jgi:hypothetical protein
MFKWQPARALALMFCLCAAPTLASDTSADSSKNVNQATSEVLKEFVGSLAGITSVRLEVKPNNVSYAVEVMDGWIDQVACIYDTNSQSAVSALLAALRDDVLEVHPIVGRGPVATWYAIRLSSGPTQVHSIFFYPHSDPPLSDGPFIGAYEAGTMLVARELRPRLEAWRKRTDVRLTRAAPAGSCGLTQ